MSMENVDKLLATNEIVKTFEHRGETFHIRKEGCEGSFARPGFYWLISWQMERMVDGSLIKYEKVTPVWEPCSEADVKRALDHMEADARKWGNSPSE